MIVCSLYTGGNLIVVTTTCDLHKERGSGYVLWDRFEMEAAKEITTLVSSQAIAPAWHFPPITRAEATHYKKGLIVTRQVHFFAARGPARRCPYFLPP